MLLAIGAVILGFIIMIYSADWFVHGAASLADHWGMSKLMIGLTIVAFGTSAPEIIVSLFAAMEGSPEIAVGNALGSNLANVGLVLGITILLAPIAVSPSLVKTELPILLSVLLLAGYCLYDASLNITESFILIGSLICFLTYLYKRQSNISIEESSNDEDDEVGELLDLSQNKAFGFLFGGLALLLISAEILVWGAKTLALIFGVPELVIGLTIVAVGTSLPELAASVASARRGHHEIAFGNIIGSNIFNILVVMAVPGFVATQQLSESVFSRDYLAMMIISALWMLMMVFCVKFKRTFSRPMGGLLLISYVIYYVVLATQL